MAYIESFTVEGLANHKRPVSRRLHRHVNIFWGLNGTGKTSLLKILHGALLNEVGRFERVPFARAEVVIRNDDFGFTIKRSYTKPSSEDEGDPDEGSGYELERMGDGLWREIRDEESSAGWQTEVVDMREPDFPARAAFGPIRHSYLPISRLNELNQATRPYNGAGLPRRGVDDSYLDEQFADEVKRRWQLYNAEALSSIRNIQQQGLASILAHLFGGGSGMSPVDSDKVPGEDAYVIVRDFLREQGIHLSANLKGFQARYDEQTDLRTVVANIQEVKIEVAEALRPQREFQTVIENLYSGGKHLVLESSRPRRGAIGIEVEGQRIPLESLSSGEKQLLRLMLETLAAETSTVMIDEPELSMHVDWQQVLVTSMLKVNPECQLLLATHSPEVMADIPAEFVFQL